MGLSLSHLQLQIKWINNLLFNNELIIHKEASCSCLAYTNFTSALKLGITCLGGMIEIGNVLWDFLYCLPPPWTWSCSVELCCSSPAPQPLLHCQWEAFKIAPQAILVLTCWAFIDCHRLMELIAGQLHVERTAYGLQFFKQCWLSPSSFPTSRSFCNDTH